MKTLRISAGKCRLFAALKCIGNVPLFRSWERGAVKERTGLFYPGAPLELTIRLADPVVRCLLLRPYAYKHLARTNEAIGVLEASKLVLDFRPDRWAFCFRHTREHLV